MGPGVILAASWTHNFSNFNAFANWLNNSNFAGIFLGIFIPGIFTYAWITYQGRKTRAHITAHHLAVHEHLQRIEAKLSGEDPPPPPEVKRPDVDLLARPRRSRSSP